MEFINTFIQNICGFLQNNCKIKCMDNTVYLKKCVIFTDFLNASRK